MRPPEITIRKVGNLPVWLVSTMSRTALAMTFVRMQEYYESTNPRFYGKVFTLDAYKTWYTKEHGSWSYANDWGGFNVPGDVVRAVLWQFPNHTKEENRLFGRLEKLGVFNAERFYLIGARKNEESALKHELRHALYYIKDAYRREVNAVLEQFPTRSLGRTLRKMGYAESVLLDEKQAYALTGWPSQTRYVTKEMRLLRRTLREVEKKYLHLLPTP